jgi:riboflavin kinase/FMN adenylyltransferase
MQDTFFENVSPSFRHTATVIHGEKVGRTIGFPTANFSSAPDSKDLKQGVYFGTCTVIGSSEQQTSTNDCLAYFGPRYIFGEEVNSFEVFIYDLDQDIYGKKCTVVLSHFLRAPKKIKTIDQLQLLLERDKLSGELLRSKDTKQ